jgi:diguanylate cyclase (GGDEF)-like protein
MTGYTHSVGTTQQTDRVTPFADVEYLKLNTESELAQTLELTNKLQSTLDLESVVELFVESIRLVIPYDGATFQIASADLYILFGHQAKHHVSYQLKLLEQDLGEIHLTRKHAFSEDELQHLETLLAVLLYPLRNALLYREAIQSAFIDALTEVKNRAAFDSNLKREIELSHRKATELSLIVFDIDHFKRVNDRYGHTVGDLALKNVAQTVEATIRASDALYRVGGEEFAVVLNGTDIKGAGLLAERIRQNIDALVFTQPRGLHVTLSLGIATLWPNDTPYSLFERADEALYQAKEGGRNRVVLSPD